MKKSSVPLLIAFAIASPLVAAAQPATQPAEVRIQQGGGQVIIRGNVRGQIVIDGEQIDLDEVIEADEPGSGPVRRPAPPPAPPALPAVPSEQGARIRTVDKRFAGATDIALTLSSKHNRDGSVLQSGQIEFLAGGTRSKLGIGEIVRVDLRPGSKTAVERMTDNAIALLLCNGEWLVGLVSGGDARNVTMLMLGVGEVAVPLRSIRGIVAPTGRAGQSLVQVERALLAERPVPAPGQPAVSDVLRLANGETVLGTIVQINANGCVVQGPMGQLTIDFDVLTLAEVANPVEQISGPAMPLMAWIELANGSRLLASSLEFRKNSMKLQRLAGEADMNLPAGDIHAVEVINGRWRWLDNIRPLLDEHRPFLTVRWPSRFGVNVVGGPLRIGGQSYSYGIGVHSASRLIFDVKGGSRFYCEAGLDISAGPLADVDVYVLLDGKVAMEHKSASAGAKPIVIDLPLNGAQKLELRVEFGANGDVQDRFNWADAAIIH